MPETEQKNPAKPAFDPSKEGRANAKHDLAEAKKLYKAGKGKIAKEVEEKFVKALEKLEASIKSEQGVDLDALACVNETADSALKPFKKSAFREVVESLLFALAFALVLRTFFVEPFKIPTRSMVPTLLEGDQLFVTKLSYGIRLPFVDKYIAHFSAPQRGDVVVFSFPREEAHEHLTLTNSQCMRPESLAEEKDYIKRIIGVEGDTIEVIERTHAISNAPNAPTVYEHIVLVNGEPLVSKPFYEHMVFDKPYIGNRTRGYWNDVQHGTASFTTMTHQKPDNKFGPITVKPGHIFVMGDNRDNSLDSRCWGQVPVENIKGRAQIIWLSQSTHGIRWDRMFTSIH